MSHPTRHIKNTFGTGINSDRLMSNFSNMDVSIYANASPPFPEKIKALFILESPPAFKGNLPIWYFYFKDAPGLEVLFSTVMGAV